MYWLEIEMIHLSTDDHIIMMYYQSLQDLNYISIYNSDDHHWFGLRGSVLF
jgi:hypothetical protein